MATPISQMPQAAPPHVPVNPDTPITVKVSYNGAIRRFKLPLRDLGPAVLPTKLRVALAIPEDQDVRFERYSDSAASFVVLDTDNLTVYKQLYRAAKAKLKLRLKATVITPETGELLESIQRRLAGVAITDISSVDNTIGSNPPAYTSQVTLATVEPTPSPAPVVPQPVVANVVVPEAVKAPVEPQPESIDYTQAIADQVTSYFAGDTFAQQLQQQLEVEVDKRMKELSLKNVVPEPVKTECKIGACIEPEVIPSSRSFLVYCNKCQGTISGEHYHCSICDTGDYDLCATCVDNGVHCEGDHWLIKRTLEKGRIVSSTTEYNKRKQRSKAPSPQPEQQEQQQPPPPPFRTRTCNCCIASLPEECFVTCTVCEDYDICLPCHIAQKHGHHPMHGFTPATKDTPLDAIGTALLEPGRGIRHHAICDGCNATINGVRHKCLACPDWDYCTACVQTAPEIHPGHRFVKIYEAINIAPQYGPKTIHNGVRCDGPLCRHNVMYILGDRYKCAICDDLDFCANCEASPLNDHNKTHPLIKMKTALQGITCSTTEATPTGPGCILGDVRSLDPSILKSTTNAATQVQTVADVEPSTEYLDEKKVPVEHSEPIPVPVKEPEPLQAEYLRDIISDGTLFTSGTKFEQVWTLTNTGTSAWPAGVTVRFVGGDHMFRHGSEESCIATVTGTAVNPGETASFAVDLTAPFTSNRRVISYWRLTAPNGSRFGHKLWCDIEILKEEKKQLIDLSETIKYDDKLDEKVEDSDSSASSQMIFPKLEKESQILAVEEAIPTEVETETEAETEVTLPGTQNPAASPAWTLTLSEEEGHTSDGVTSEDDVDSLMLDDDYEVLETSDDDGLYV
ncbi:hypothetical protein TWF569_008395 [Orbilia oligospora]|uniref:ZZ-type domain-containing protein n=1 Tax=Orbilia oligospora TaxID=2813651 RepID=A0A7C8J4R5_ORBOL|nr:hypothetical protein TWF103_001414 [Orbilia oligospora]KAF3094459.1 hypothetical protein TWF102_007575 [Orbilia oligospora]KAF3107231.1 hypothetical protein TWF706_002935 [Orbilia oligospora]KAF3120950.1 hypothetical protein TWF703_002249 [Orbilia oligospora]KAF3139980.1 hypothetical protein TWF569_008395 [Orbilia oligospora]